MGLRMIQNLSRMNKLPVLILIIALSSSHLPLSIFGDLGILPDNTPFNIAFLFSGEKTENLTACPWIFENITSEEIRGLNEVFRDYFSNDLSSELTAYPQIDSIYRFEYTDTYNYFTGLGQYDPDHRWYPQEGVNVSKFDPYYCLVKLYFDMNQTWDNQLTHDIELLLLNKWYVEQVMIIPDARVPRATPFGTDHFYITMLLILTVLTLFRRIHKL